MADKTFDHRTILQDASKTMFTAAKQRAVAGATDEARLLTKAAILLLDASNLPIHEFLKAAESISAGVNFGTAAIAQETAKKFWRDLLRNSVQLATSLATGAIENLLKP